MLILVHSISAKFLISLWQVGLVLGLVQGSCSSKEMFLSGSDCVLGCMDGYTQIGNMLVTCVAGSWSSVNGKCEAKDCLELPDEVGVVPGLTGGTCSDMEHHPSGSNCTLGCLSGLRQVGEMLISCVAGLWSTVLGHCESPSQSENITVSVNTSEPPSSVEHSANCGVGR